MASRPRVLRIERLEGRLAPATVTIGAGSDYTLRVNDTGRFAGGDLGDCNARLQRRLHHGRCDPDAEGNVCRRNDPRPTLARMRVARRSHITDHTLGERAPRRHNDV